MRSLSLVKFSYNMCRPLGLHDEGTGSIQAVKAAETRDGSRQGNIARQNACHK